MRHTLVTAVILLASSLSAQSGSFTTYGAGCSTVTPTIATSGTPNIGSSITVGIHSAASGSRAIWGIGLAPAAIDLTAFGATGCSILTIPMALVAAETDEGGGLQIRQNIPFNQSCIGATFYTQFAVFAPVNAAGISLSSGLKIVLGIGQQT